MTLQQIRYFISVAESGSISEAAKRLFTAQSSISSAIKEIENTYDIAVNAFGFCDDGNSTPNTHTSSEVKVSFNDWIFPLDGVAVALKEKCTNHELGN